MLRSKYRINVRYLDVWKWYKKFMEFYNQCHVIILDRWSICNILVNEKFQTRNRLYFRSCEPIYLIAKKSFHACWVFIKNPYYMKFLKLFLIACCVSNFSMKILLHLCKKLWRRRRQSHHRSMKKQFFGSFLTSCSCFVRW